MNFSDIFFLGYFLPLILIVARLLSAVPRTLVPFRLALILGTLFFYGFENFFWILIFLTTILPAYLLSFAVATAKSESWRRTALIAGIVICLGTLIIFKYLNWFSTLLPQLAPMRVLVAQYFGKDGTIQLPPGISFYAFEAISFIVDTYRQRFEFPRKFLDYASFICLFPRFIAGPIVRYTDVSDQIRHWPGMNMDRGLTIFALGFTLKIAFADQFAKFVPYAFGVKNPDFLQSLVGSVAYSFQLYFDFWGYSVMAMGLGLCFGFQFPDNFIMPYRARSVTEFWRRWHITLSRWLRDYLYIPLGGNRCPAWRHLLNILITMLLAGLWHGASALFLLWGIWHGILMVMERLTGLDQTPERFSWLMRGYTLMVVFCGWILFRSTSMEQLLGIYSGLTGAHGWGSQFNSVFIERHLFSVALAALGLLFWMFGENRLMGEEGLLGKELSRSTVALILMAFVVSLLIRFSEDGIPFLYFQF